MNIFEQDLAQYYPEGTTSITRRLFMATRHPAFYQTVYNESATLFIDRRKQRFIILKQSIPTNVWEYPYDDCKINN